MRGVTFAKGDPVIVTSRVTGEEFHGEITVVKPKAVSPRDFLSSYAKRLIPSTSLLLTGIYLTVEKLPFSSAGM